MMSLPMKWCISASLPGRTQASKSSPRASQISLKLDRYPTGASSQT